MKILITGDVVVNRKYDPVEKIDPALIELFSQSDINIINLEAPVTESGNKILKTGANLKSHCESITSVLKTLNVKVATLANNHILDYSERGIIDTLSFCHHLGVKTVGAGMNLAEASKTLYLNTEEGKVGVVNFAENEWASATATTAGANPMDIIDNAAQIKDARDNADYVVVIIHGGHEYYNLPSPRMQKYYRFYAEQGADIVVGHHTHCISGFEEFNGVPIFHGLGNFLFTIKSKFEGWYNGLVLEIVINGGKLNYALHPVLQNKETFKLSLIKANLKTQIQTRIEEYSSIIKDKNKLDYEWEQYVASKSKTYLVVP